MVKEREGDKKRIANKGDRSVYHLPAYPTSSKGTGLKGPFKNLWIVVYKGDECIGQVLFKVYSLTPEKKSCRGLNLLVDENKREEGNALFLMEEALKFLWKEESVHFAHVEVEYDIPSQKEYSPKKSVFLCLRLGFKLADYAEVPKGMYLLTLSEENYRKLLEEGVKRMSRREVEKLFEKQKELIRKERRGEK